MTNFGVSDVSQSPQAERSSVRGADDGLREGVAVAEEEERAAEKRENAKVQSDRWGAIEELKKKKADELAVAIRAGDMVLAEEIRRAIQVLEEQKDKAADRLMGGVKQDTDSVVQ